VPDGSTGGNWQLPEEIEFPSPVMFVNCTVGATAAAMPMKAVSPYADITRITKRDIKELLGI